MQVGERRNVIGRNHQGVPLEERRSVEEGHHGTVAEHLVGRFRTAGYPTEHTAHVTPPVSDPFIPRNLPGVTPHSYHAPMAIPEPASDSDSDGDALDHADNPNAHNPNADNPNADNPDADTPQLVGFDIETDTSTGGLDPTTSRVVAIALSAPDGDEVFVGAEHDLLASVDRRISELPSGLLVTWNGAGFDLPFVAHRAELLGVPIGLATSAEPLRRSMRDPDRPAVRGRWHRLVHLDGYQLYRADVGRTLGLSCGLKPLARLAGMEPVELDRTRLHLEKAETIADYVASDARLAAQLVRRRMPNALSIADYDLGTTRSTTEGSPG